MLIVSVVLNQGNLRRKMGFNTTVVVMNDNLHLIEKDPEFGKRLAQAIMRLDGEDKPANVAAYGAQCIAANAATVIETHHNSSTAIVAVGGNYAHVLGWAGDVPHHTDEGKLACLKALAEAMGYRLVKKGEK